MSPRLVTIGDNVVDCYVDLGSMYPGGNTVNVAVHAARLGVDATYIGVLGDDEAGRTVLQALRSEGVDTSALRVAAGENARAIVRIKDGDRIFECGSIGVSAFRPTEQDLATLAAAEIVHTGDCSFLEDHLSVLKRHARLLSFDFSEQPWDYIATHAPQVDLAICSVPDQDHELAVQVARRVRELGPDTVVVTQGAAGATLLGDDLVHAPAGAGEIVDTLGAGDAFTARLLVGLLRGENPQQFLPAATQYATDCCAEFGAFGHQAPLPTGIT